MGQDTVLKGEKIKLGIRTVLSLSFAFVGMIAVFILIFFVNFYLKKYFKEYSVMKQEDRNQKIVSLIKNQYNKDKLWDSNIIQNIGISLLEEGLIIKLTDNKGIVVWDAMEYNSGICERMINNIKEKMTTKYPDIQGNLINKTYLINYNKEPIGSLQIGFYSPFFYTDSEFIFIDALNRLIIIITVISLIISIIIGYLISQKLANTITKVISTTGKISKGLYDIRINEKSVIMEFNELINSVNNLALNLEAQDKLRKRLTLDVSHELRTPLTTLQAHIEAMIDGIWEPTIERLRSFHEEILRINNLVKDLTSLSKLEHENLKLNKVKINIKILILNQLKLYENQFIEKNITTELSGDDIEISVDKDKFTQVIINLISNAVKYTDHNGQFSIDIKQLKNIIYISFTNSGENIPSEDLPFIFERFYRIDKSRTRATGGAGIGLSITKEIILTHGGDIKAESGNNKNKFIITLPL